MNNINELLDKKRKYETLKANIGLIINKLTSAIENLETPVNKIKNSYTIDSISIDEAKFDFVKQSLISKRNYLQNTVLYSINIEINKIKKNIESAG